MPKNKSDALSFSVGEVQEVLNWAWDSIDKGESKFRGMSYEEGVRDALDWILGNAPPPSEL